MSELKNNSLADCYPEIAQQWHPTKNGDLTPKDVFPKSGKNVWWKCPKGDDHEWETRIIKRTQLNGTKCPICSNKKVVASNCLATTHPTIAKEWHLTKNAGLAPNSVTAGANKVAHWQCTTDPSHEWSAKIADRTKQNGTNCPYCANRKFDETTSLYVTHPEIASEWHPDKNGTYTPEKISARSTKKVWWQCAKDPNHEWEAMVRRRTLSEKTGCPFCTNRRISKSNSLATTHPQLVTEWHSTKNKKNPHDITAGSAIKVWWQCLDNSEHVWQTTLAERAKSMSKCPFCSKRKTTIDNSLAITHPDIAAQWHPTRNTKTPYQITSICNQKVWWKCPQGDDHEWETSVEHRTKRGAGCPVCINRKVVPSNCLEMTHPEIAREWHPTKNGDLSACAVTAGYGHKIWWVCSINNQHEWAAKVYDRTRLNKGKCPFCQSVWSIEKIKFFVQSLLPYIDNLTPAELYVIFQQNGILSNQSKAKKFTDILKTGKFPKKELEKFIAGEASIIDSLITDTKDTEQLAKLEEKLEVFSEDLVPVENEELPIIETQDILKTLETDLISNADEETVDFFIKSAVAKIWKHVFFNERDALTKLELYDGNGKYSKEVKNLFLTDYHGARELQVPEGYNFPYQPNLMQLYTSYLIKKQKRLGNWSGTGAGKTLSAILASRIIDAKLTVICCPNNVIAVWEKSILEAYPNSSIFLKEVSHKKLNLNKQHKYLILNYEFFQQPKTESKLKELLKFCSIDFIIIDEIHYSKQRELDKMSKRKKVISSFLSEAASINTNLHVLGMSATPVINNLFEGKTLIEIVTGIYHNDLKTISTVPNCISLYQKFVSHGIRYIPNYNYKMNIIIENIDCSSFISEIAHQSIMGTMIDLESILTKAKLSCILKYLRPKTIVYTHYLKDILYMLQESIEKKGWKTAIFTGEHKDSLNDFIKGKADILIASSCIGTGIDGLQKVCNRLIVNSLPWTHAEFEQLKGRIYRQGQLYEEIDIIVPLTFAQVNGSRWSWCESRWKRIQFKKSIADAAVDGVIPEGHLRTPAQAYKDAMSWLDRLQRGEINKVERKKISIPLSDKITENSRRKFGDLTQMNHNINQDHSNLTHQCFLKNPKKWEYYHAIYRENRKTWPIVPYQEAIKWFKARKYMTIGDFGCGEALLAAGLENQVYSFDHIAINKTVIAGDMSHVSLDDECLDAAVFSLSLMGSNFIDYLREAHRCLKLDGHLWIAEPTSRIRDITLFSELIFRLGFDITNISEKWKFSFLRAIKTERQINEDSIKIIDSKHILS